MNQYKPQKGLRSLDSILENQDELAEMLLSKMCMRLSYILMQLIKKKKQQNSP